VRSDRLASLCFSRLLRSVRSRRPKAQLPILMYHSVSSDSEVGVRPYYRVATNPCRFAEHLQWLADLGYRGVALEEALPIYANGDESRGRSVAITFDDGFRDFHAVAWPLLQRHGFTATMYLPTGFVSPNRKSFRGKECLTWDEVRELRRHGVRFGSHTVSHPKLYELSWENIEGELTISKRRIEQELEEEVISFAYPYAFPQEDRGFAQRFRSMLLTAGYRNCVTTVIGCAQAGDDPFCLRRLPANSCDDKALLAAKLEGAYDWLALVQRGFRLLKRTQRRVNPDDGVALK